MRKSVVLIILLLSLSFVLPVSEISFAQSIIPQCSLTWISGQVTEINWVGAEFSARAWTTAAPIMPYEMVFDVNKDTEFLRGTSKEGLADLHLGD